MKHEEAYKKATRAFRDDEDDILLRLAKLKERADYRKYFSVELRNAVESAYANIEKANAKGPGHFADDEEVHNTSAHFLGALRHRFGIQQLGIPPYRTTAEWLDVLDPRMDVREIPPKVRRSVLPRLFYTPGIREVVPESDKLNKHPPEIAETTSPDCAPYERLWKIDLRKKPSVLLREFKASLAKVDALRDMNPTAYEAWKQDRSRKRAEEWTHLEAWRLRRQVPKPSFPEIAKRLRITPAAAKKSFYRAYELIYGKPFDLEAWKKDRAEKPFKTCANCPQREGCTEPCPEIFEEKTSTREYLAENLAEIGDSHSYNEWLTREEENE